MVCSVCDVRPPVTTYPGGPQTVVRGRPRVRLSPAERASTAGHPPRTVTHTLYQ